jgi:hypothetical protein
MTNISDITIGLWGSFRSGKTTFLVQLFDLLTKSNNWEVSADDNALKYVSEIRRYLNIGQFPPSTEIAEEYNLYTYILRPTPNNHLIYNKKKDITINLKFVDAPGEWYENFEGEEPLNNISAGNTSTSQTSSGISNVVKYLHDCAGVIYLLDPGYKDKLKVDTYEELLAKLFNRINNYGNKNLSKQRRTHEQYVVFGVTQADRADILIEIVNPQSTFDLVRKKLNHDRNRPEQIPVTWFMNFFTLDKITLENQFASNRYLPANIKHRCQFFAISSIGVYLDNNFYKSPVTLKNKVASPPPPTPHIGLGVSASGGTVQPPPTSPSPFSSAAVGTFLEEQISIPPNNVTSPFNVVESLEWIIKGIILDPTKYL